MPIEPEIKHLIDYYYSLNIPEYNHSTSVELVRELMRNFTNKATGQLSPNIKEVKDHYFDTTHGKIRVRSYHPKFNKFKKPLIYFRGSGFIINNFDEHNVFCSKLASHCETTLLAIDYPLSPEHTFPVAIEACYQTLLKIVSKATLFDIDSKNFVLIGESSGGCLAASLAQMLRDKKGPAIGYQVLIYPVTDHNFQTDSYKMMGSGNIMSEAKMRWYFSKYFAKEEDMQKPYALPMNAKDFSNLPRTLIMTAQYDPLCDDGKNYAEELKKAHVPCELINYKGLIHGFLKFNGIPAAEKAFLDLVHRIHDFLEKS